MLLLGVGEAEAQISAEAVENQGLYPEACSLASQEARIPDLHQGRGGKLSWDPFIGLLYLWLCCVYAVGDYRH